MERRWKVLALVSVGVFMVSLDLFIVNIAFPEIEGDFAGSSVSTISWVLNAYAIVIAALMVSAGRLADRHGRKRLFLWGLGIFVLGSALCGAAPSVETLVGARVIQAAGAALLLPTSLALLLPEFEPSRALARDRHLGGGRRSRRRCGPARRRPPRRAQLAARVPRQRAHRAGRDRLRHPAC